MAVFTILTPTNIDSLVGKTGQDTYTINGGTLTIDQDSRYGVEANTSATLGAVTTSATLGAGDLTLSTGSTGLALADQEYTSTYVYVGMDSGAGWQIYRRTRTTNVRQYASGVSDYSTAWTNRVGLIYS